MEDSNNPDESNDTNPQQPSYVADPEHSYEGDPQQPHVADPEHSYKGDPQHPPSMDQISDQRSDSRDPEKQGMYTVYPKPPDSPESIQSIELPEDSIVSNLKESFLGVQVKPMSFSRGMPEPYGDSEPSYPGHLQKPLSSYPQEEPNAYTQMPYTPGTEETRSTDIYPPYSAETDYTTDPNQSYSYSPDPNQSYTSDPNQNYSSDPNQYYSPDHQPYSPDQNQPYSPDQNQPYSPDQNQPYSPDPNQSYSPDPNQSYSPDPNQYYSPDPYQSYSPDPYQSYSPDPYQSYSPDPNQSYSPDPNRQGSLEPYPPHSVDDGYFPYDTDATDSYGKVSPHGYWGPKEPRWSSEGGYAFPGHGYGDSANDLPQYSPDEYYGQPVMTSKTSITSDSVSEASGRCKEFHLKELADHLVKGTLKAAVEGMKVEAQEDWKYYTKGTEGPNIEWPSNYEFSLDVGEKKIEEFLDTWKISQAWYHCVDFMALDSDLYADYYKYEAKWSIPTAPYPIPQATVSVFFTIEVSRIKPNDCPVIVTFQFESDPFIHKPGDSKIREDWINDILKRKIEFFKTLQF